MSDPSKRASSTVRDESVIRVHLNPKLGSRALSSITPRDIQALVNDWSERRSSGTVRRNYATLQAILSAAVASDVLGRTPCRNVKLPDVHTRAPHIVTAEDLAALA